MGSANSSSEIMGSNRPALMESYTSVSGQRLHSDLNVVEFPKSAASPPISRSLLHVEFFGKWSVLYPECVCPIARLGQCSCYLPEKDCLYVCYGENPSEGCLNDLWCLSFTPQPKWRLINQCLLSPRSGCTSTLIPRGTCKYSETSDVIFIFGGCCKGEFYADPHIIEVETGKVINLETTGPQPEARKDAVIGFYDGKVTIWGGCNIGYPTSISVLDLNTLVWTEIESQIPGRASPAFTISDNNIWIFGSTKTQSLLRLDMKTSEIEHIDTIGVNPPSINQSAFMIKFDNYLMVFGGKGDYTSTHVYAFDIERRWWFLFHVKPDGETVTSSDGNVTSGGLFLLPSDYGYAACYRECAKEVVGVFGSSLKEPPPINKISIGNAISFLNHRKDMLEML